MLGAGNFASAVMLPSLQKISCVDFVGVVSGSGVSAQHLARKFGFRYADSSAERIFADPDINTVAILTRHDTHAELIVKALQQTPPPQAVASTSGDNSGALLLVQLGNRDYVVTIDFVGRRYVEIPNGEVSWATGAWGWRMERAFMNGRSSLKGDLASRLSVQRR